MKQRVKRIGGVYYAQYRRWGIWRNYEKLVGYETYTAPIGFATYESANNYCCNMQLEIINVKCSKGSK